MTFRPAERREHPAIETLLRAAFTPYVNKLGRELAKDAYGWLEPAIAANRVFVGLESDRIVGVVATSRDQGVLTIEQIAVSPGGQALGIGSWLLNETEAIALFEGVTALALDTAVMMEDLIRLYRRHGFEEVERGMPTHGKDKHPRIYLRKDL